MEALVGGLLCLLCLAVWVGCRIEDKRARQAACVHAFGEPFCVYGKYWSRTCPRCKKTESCSEDGHPLG